ncbi:PEP-CTERM sorting domain-containing protein [Microcoleus sp. B4-D4]|uniref:PEP-CTERM sorting domain-containing protein n=1 Tax=Microcoleus sp. B4-D4 TaxID=2818667 RepID=UPI002FD778EB
MPVIFDCLLLSQSAVGATFNFNVSVNGKTIGNIGLNEAAGIGGKGLEGSFTPTGRTIPELMTYLAQGDPNNTPPNHLNWLQVVTKSIYPASASGRPQANFIDPIKGGFSTQLSDSEPWYYDEYVPAPLPNKDSYDTWYLRTNQTTNSALSFEDIVRQPPGTQLTFNTFLIADYGDKTYRPLGEGFQWSIESKPHPLNPQAGIVQLTSPPASVKYNPSLFDSLVSAFGYTRRTTPLLSKTFSGTLASGYQIDNYNLDKLTPGSKYTAWTNNDLPSNRCNPNTYLSTSSPGSGGFYDDNSSPLGNGFASGLTGTVGNNGTLNLAVQAANGGARGEDKGNYELFVNVYEDGESPTFSNGNSGGGGFGKEMRGLTQQNPILPTSVQSGWQTFSKVPGCRWYDPYTTYGFEFQSLEDTLFTEILDFPVGDDTEFAVTVGNVLLGTFGPGSSVDFVSLLGHGISNFKITGINSLFGSTAETAFPIQLAFNEREGSFKMRAISADDAENVPEPTTVLGTLLAVGGLGIIKKLKNRKNKE